MSEEVIQKRKLWEFPWKYKESFLISFGLLFIGILLEFIKSGAFITPPSFPVNLYILIFIITYIVVTSKFIKHPFINWLGSIPAAISAITVLTFLILLMGFIPQTEVVAHKQTLISKLGLNHIVRSYPYILLSLYLLLILGYTIMRRLLPLNFKNFSFFLNHFGLWLVLAVGSLGTGDTMKFYMPVKINETTWKAFDTEKNYYELPIAINLLDFKVDEYAPNLILVDANTGMQVENNKKQKPAEVRAGTKVTINEWNLKIEKYFQNSLKYKNEFVEVKENNSSPAAYVIAENSLSNKKIEGWISSGNKLQSHNFLRLEDKTVLVLTKPIPKAYRSKVKIYTKENSIENFDILINKPANINGWEIYQSSYEKSMSDDSYISIFELIYDPWLKFVYFGIYMLIAGSVLLFWHGKLRKSKNN